jgi:hypothetical protein
VASIDVQSEQDIARGWVYEVAVTHSGGLVTRHAVTLSWADHDFWSGGASPPSKVVEAVVSYLITHRNGEGLPPKFDAARARRWYPEIDRELRGGL